MESKNFLTPITIISDLGYPYSTGACGEEAGMDGNCGVLPPVCTFSKRFCSSDCLLEEPVEINAVAKTQHSKMVNASVQVVFSKKSAV